MKPLTSSSMVMDGRARAAGAEEEADEVGGGERLALKDDGTGAEEYIVELEGCWGAGIRITGSACLTASVELDEEATLGVVSK